MSHRRTLRENTACLAILRALLITIGQSIHNTISIATAKQIRPCAPPCTTISVYLPSQTHERQFFAHTASLRNHTPPFLIHPLQSLAIPPNLRPLTRPTAETPPREHAPKLPSVAVTGLFFTPYWLKQLHSVQ